MAIDISGVTADGSNIGSYRSTKYEAHEVRVSANSVWVACSERGIHGSSPVQIEVTQSLFTPEQVATIQAALSLLEEGFRAVHDAKEEELGLAGATLARAEVHRLVTQAEAAREAKSKAEAETTALRREQARLDGEAVVKRAEITALDAEIAAKRAEGPGASSDAFASTTTQR
jgi:hypothetical protein